MFEPTAAEDFVVWFHCDWDKGTGEREEPAAMAGPDTKGTAIAGTCRMLQILNEMNIQYAT